mgnify:FL=1|tara:strand:- start:22 stop:204 length:183 start_codon:yes stop_codon:yes gene_type:complete
MFNNKKLINTSTLDRMTRVELEALNKLLDGEATEHEREILDKASDRLISLYSSEVLGNEE